MEEKHELLLFKILAGIAGILGLSIIIKVLLSNPVEMAVGERFVIKEFVFPTAIYTFHFKPVTLLVIFGFLWWSLGLESFRNEIKKFPKWIKKLIFIFLALSSFVFAYEALHNFLLWMSFYTIYQGNLDLLHHQINPAMPKPVNFNFISKIFSMFLAGSLYGLYFFHKLLKEPEQI
ncbi:MAG: hypothetical protein QW476_01110 [Candidatus Bathyarchaeia archaeon]|nr:hypothetical protein [Candidatus Bathyarchaeota archaeon]